MIKKVIHLKPNGKRRVHRGSASVANRKETEATENSKYQIKLEMKEIKQNKQKVSQQAPDIKRG